MQSPYGHAGQQRRLHICKADAKASTTTSHDKFTEDCIFLGTEQIALILPLITLGLKVPLMLPCLDWRLTRIRAGREYSGLAC